jgi:hypothetical protein
MINSGEWGLLCIFLLHATSCFDGTLRKTFAKWYPAMAANDRKAPIPAETA